MADQKSQQTPKVKQQQHLDRWAIVYHRSAVSPSVSEEGINCLPDHLRNIAVESGWPEQRVKVITKDFGCSGSSLNNREGIEWVLDEIKAGRVGAIFCAEVSRLSRDPNSLQIILDLCSSRDTLIVTKHGIHDLRNDMRVLDVLAIINEIELKQLKGRLQSSRNVL